MNETPWKVGDLVRLPGQPVWGLGRILRIRADYVDVFFVDREGTDAVALSQKKLLITRAEVATHPWLDNLPPFKEDSKGKLRLAEDRLTHKQAVAKFERLFPGGFDDPAYLGEGEGGERAYKWRAHRQWAVLLGSGKAEELLQAGQIRALVQLALSVEAKTNLLSLYEKAALKDGLADDVAADRFFRALLALIREAEPSEAAFAAYAEALAALPEPKGRANTWPNATIFPFLANPAVHMFLKPEVTKDAERRMGFQLNYKPTPNWLTYKCVRELGGTLLKELAALGARDFIDVQSFIWVAVEYEDAPLASGARSNG